MADITQLHEIALKYSQLSQASYHSGDIDLSSSYNIINIKNDTYEGYSKMADNNFGFQGNIPAGVSIEDNIKKALEYKDTHSALETLNWCRKIVVPQSHNSVREDKR